MAADLAAFDPPYLRGDGGRPTPIALEDTEHFRLTRDVLASPGSFWRHLRGDGDS